MNKKTNILITFMVLFCCTLSVNAQQNPRIKKKTFFSTKSEMKTEAKTFRLAQRFYRKEKIRPTSLRFYRKLYKYNPTSPELNYKIGVCYLLSSDKTSALEYLLKSKPEVAKDYYYLLGKAYQYNKQFDDAKDSYQKYYETLKKWQQREQESEIQQLFAECDFGKKMVKDSVDVFIVNLGPLINSYYDEYSACNVPLDDKIYFTTRRPDVEPKKLVSRFKYKERIYASENCIEKPTEWVGELRKLNKRTNVAIAGTDTKNKRIFYYEGKKNNGRLLIAKYNEKKKRWQKGGSVKGRINHIAYRETSITFDDNNTAYFVSTRRGGEGGKDIWMARHKKKNRWGKPVNLGDVINTPFDEEGVYITPDGGTLYFSSKGHRGMGGFDVYKSIRQPDGKWSVPENLGYPINSPADEMFYYPTADTMVALYSTVRDGGYGGLDIYKIKKDPRKPFSLVGEITDSETGQILSANINVIDNKTSKALETAKLDTSKQMYMINFEDIGDYSVQIDKKGYTSASFDVECPNEKHATVVKDVQLTLLKHPFTLAGTINDISSYEPLSARISFKDKQTGTIYGERFTDANGKYSITFEDKYDMAIEISSKDYYSIDTSFNAKTNKNESAISNYMLKPSKKMYTLTGVISNLEDNTPVYASLSFYLPSSNKVYKIFLSDSTTGKYSARLDSPGPFLIEIEAPNYFFLNDTYRFANKEQFGVKNFKLKQMSKGATIVVENILFNTGKSTLKAQSFAGLDKLADLLRKNPKVRIEVSGHTDNVGSASLNKRLSKARALSVRNYLISRGIDPERMEYEGYGFDKPIAPNTTPEGREQNRRVEIKVLD